MCTKEADINSLTTQLKYACSQSSLGHIFTALVAPFLEDFSVKQHVTGFLTNFYFQTKFGPYGPFAVSIL